MIKFFCKSGDYQVDKILEAVMKPVSDTNCDGCVHKDVCKYADDVRRIKLETGASFELCKFYGQTPQIESDEEKREEEKPSEEKPSLEMCERCGKKSYKLFECETCHKKVCSSCAEIEQELDVNTGGFEEHVHCIDCAEEE